MARLCDDTFEMLVIAQHKIALHGGVETIMMEVSIFFIYYLAVLVTAALAGIREFLWCYTHGLTRRDSFTHP